MTHLREHWQGVSLPGDFILEQWLGGDQNAAFFQTSLPAGGRHAVVKLLPEAAVDSAAQLALWQRTRQLRHPNLLELLDCGRADLDGEIILYAVFESPDDTLASALARSPLNPEESREVLDSVIDALRHLHSHGLASGPLDPEHIVAIGDRIKLSTDSLREAAGPGDFAGDIGALGALWQQSLLRASPRSAAIAAHAADPNPQTRWSLDEIAAALAIPMPAAAAPDLPPPHPRPTTAPAVPYSFPKWIIVATGALLLLILVFNLRRPGEVATSHPLVAPVSVPAETAHAPSPAAVPVPAKPSPTAAGKEVWRVIAFTYRTPEPAGKKVRQINQHHPDLHASVITPKERKGYYLVALGGRMTREAAIRLQQSARGKGLPRDLYIQNFP